MALPKVKEDALAARLAALPPALFLWRRGWVFTARARVGSQINKAR